MERVGFQKILKCGKPESATRVAAVLFRGWWNRCGARRIADKTLRRSDLIQSRALEIPRPWRVQARREKASVPPQRPSPRAIPTGEAVPVWNLCEPAHRKPRCDHQRWLHTYHGWQ